MNKFLTARQPGLDYRFYRTSLLILSFLPVIVFFTAVVVFCVYASNPDHYIASQIDLFLEINHSLSGWPNFWLNTTALGDALILFPILSFLIVKNPQAWASLFGSLPLAAALSHIGKKSFAIPRPAAIIDIHQFIVLGDTLKGSSSLPSGHAITIFTAISAVTCISLCREDRDHRVALGLVLMFSATVIAVSRVAVGAHWPFDILLGAVFGSISGLCGAGLTFKYTQWWQWMAVPKFKYFHMTFLFIICYAMFSGYHQLMIGWFTLIIACLVIIKLLLSR